VPATLSHPRSALAKAYRQFAHKIAKELPLADASPDPLTEAPGASDDATEAGSKFKRRAKLGRK